jgi:hypothetical protein
MGDKRRLGGNEAAEKLIQAAHEGRKLEYATVEALHDMSALEAALTCVLALIMEQNNERAAAFWRS